MSNIHVCMLVYCIVLFSFVYIRTHTFYNIYIYIYVAEEGKEPWKKNYTYQITSMLQTIISFFQKAQPEPRPWTPSASSTPRRHVRQQMSSSLGDGCGRRMWEVGRVPDWLIEGRVKLGRLKFGWIEELTQSRHCSTADALHLPKVSSFRHLIVISIPLGQREVRTFKIYLLDWFCLERSTKKHKGVRFGLLQYNDRWSLHIYRRI